MACLVAAVYWYLPQEAGPYYWLAGVVGGLAFAVAGEIAHLYSSWRVYSFAQEAFELAAACVVSAAALIALAYLTKTSVQYSRVVMVLWWMLTFAVLAIVRFAIRLPLRMERARGRNVRSLAIVGAGSLGFHVAERVKASGWMGLRLIGFFDDNVPVGTEVVPDNPARVIGDTSAVIQLAREGRVDYVYVALPLSSSGPILNLIQDLSDTTASVFLVPDFFMFELTHARWTDIGGLPVVSIFDTPFLGVDGWLKRIEDIVLASLFIVMTLPLMLLIAGGILATSRGPVIFKQRRYGLSGKVVDVWKFRTMTVLEDGERVPQARRVDPRVTRLGAFLRRTSLDELPQFLNVLQGHMSIVGPRPHPVALNEQYRKLIAGYMLRHKVKPGITGWAQVNGWRGETDTVEKMQKRIECDLYYIRNWSVWLDLKTVMLTVVRGFSQPTAY